MTQTWIIDVLTDLRRFAEGNDMPALADQLQATEYVAASELARKVGTSEARGAKGGATTDRFSGAIASRLDA